MFDENQESTNNYFEAFSDGFDLPVKELDHYQKDLSLSSLRHAFKAYFSTYKAQGLQMYGILHRLDWKPWAVSKTSHLNSLEAYSVTILMFHHFMELIFKDLLCSAGFKITESDGFSKALEMFRSGINEGRIVIQDRCVKDEANEEWITKFNRLRNRIWHGGNFVLYYGSLDKTIGKFVVPFIMTLLEYSSYKDQGKLWKYQKLECGIDPISEIGKEMRSECPCFGKVAFLKEMGRAAYDNPIETEGYPEQRNKLIQEHAEAAADRIAKLSGGNPGLCPACGINSFVRYESPNVGRLTGIADENRELVMLKVIEKKCMCCGFNVFNNIENPSEYGFSQIENFWDDGSAFS